jgi:RNA polymerase sigma-70 factor (ECF subfamily)
VQALASEARTLLVAGSDEAARATYDELVGALQRRASRIAFHYLRDAAEVDEAVQDAFIKAYLSLASYKDHLPFDAWFMRILVNGCLDRLRFRRRRAQWLTPMEGPTGASLRHEPCSADASPEDELVAREWQRTLGEAISRLPDRQRTVVLLTHLDGRTPREVSAITGLNESTVRVHLFRAVRRLRGWLTPEAPRSREAEG